MQVLPGSRLYLPRRSGKTTMLSKWISDATQTHDRINVVAPTLEQAKFVIDVSNLDGEFKYDDEFVCANGCVIWLNRSDENLTFVDEFAFVDRLPEHDDWIGVTTRL